MSVNGLESSSGPEPSAKRIKLDADGHYSSEGQKFSLPPANAQFSATLFQEPTHVTSFSFGSKRELLLPSSGRNNDALRIYAEPPLGAHLERERSGAVMRDDSLDEGLDALLDTLMDLAPSPDTDTMIDRTQIITWRGMMTRLLKAVFAQSDDGWDMNAMFVDGTLYLEDRITPASNAQKQKMSPEQERSTYMGYAFESFSTRAIDEERAPDGWAGAVNTNIQWCSVVKGKLGSLRLIIGGEVDALNRAPQDGDIRPSHFVELKTNMAIHALKQEISFEKHKLLTMYLQSFLLGVRTIVVGFRTREGVLSALQTFQTLEIPRLVRGKPHGWDPAAAFAVGHDVASFLRDTISKSDIQQESDKLFDSCEDAEAAASIPFPVFHVHFDASARQVTMRPLDKQEVTTLVAQKDWRQRPRVGFLPRAWLIAAKARQLRISNVQRCAMTHLRDLNIICKARPHTRFIGASPVAALLRDELAFPTAWWSFKAGRSDRDAHLIRLDFKSNRDVTRSSV